MTGAQWATLATGMALGALTAATLTDRHAYALALLLALWSLYSLSD